jgi:CRISPR-associated endonuclease Cas1
MQQQSGLTDCYEQAASPNHQRRRAPMAAAQTVSHNKISRNSQRTTPSVIAIAIPRSGVVTLLGYGISARVDRGHLVLQDGVGAARRQGRFSRVAHGLKRLVVIGADGIVSLAALRWLADQNAAFVMLDRDGSVLATTGPVRSSDAKLRRAQALAHVTGAAIQIAQELINRKLVGQEQVARDKLLDPKTADVIGRWRSKLPQALTPQTIRIIESQAASVYWSAWHDLPIMFPKNDIQRVPDHWRSFGTRTSPLTGSPRVAVNPPNAMLNYLYAILESESRLACAALGLDPGQGFLHVDAPARDSLACDLMEAVRPRVDAFLLDWITRDPIRRDWFLEERNGNCRLMPELAARLGETVPRWGSAVAPIAEWVAQSLWTKVARPTAEYLPPTRLTGRHKREAREAMIPARVEKEAERGRICQGCGSALIRGNSNCEKCAVAVSTKRIIHAAKAGRIAAHSEGANARRSKTQHSNAIARYSWVPSSQPAWLTKAAYLEQIQPLLSEKSNPAIASAIGVSLYYAADIRRGRIQPHPRHWQALAQLVGVSPEDRVPRFKSARPDHA